MLVITGISKKYGHKHVLENINASFSPGTPTAIVGPNGSGKTTLVSILAGLEDFDEGKIELNGTEIDTHSTEWKASIGFVPDDDALIPGLTYSEQAEICASAYGISGSKAADRRSELFGLLGMNEYCGEIADYGSKGMRKRLGIALALLHNPKVLLLDEPFDGLDYEGSAWLAGCLADLSKRGVIVIFATHSRAMVEKSRAIRFVISGNTGFDPKETPGAEDSAFDSGSLGWIGHAE